MTFQPKKSSTETVFEAVVELHAQEQTSTRETVADVTGLKLSIIDDRLSSLVDDGRLRRVLRGVFEPVVIHPPARPISKTTLADGTVKIEVGDDLLCLTPREARVLASTMAGEAAQIAAIELGRSTAYLTAELAAKVKKLEKDNQALRAYRGDGPQFSLLDS